MALIKMKPTSPGTRFVVKIDRSHLHKGGPLESLTAQEEPHRCAQPFRPADHAPSSAAATSSGTASSISSATRTAFPESSSGSNTIRTAPSHLALVLYKDGERRYILAPKGVKAGDEIRSGADAPIKAGNALPLRHIPVGSTVHNIELKVGKGGQLARSAGGSAQFAAREGCTRSVRLKSGEMRKVHVDCRATIGEVGQRRAQPARLRQGRRRCAGSACVRRCAAS